MSHSFHQNYAHIVFSTKERRRTLATEVESDLHSYLGGIIRKLDGIPLRIGGTDDHVHILAKTPKTMGASDFMRILKANSSKWVHETFQQRRSFAWQVGY